MERLGDVSVYLVLVERVAQCGVGVGADGDEGAALHEAGMLLGYV